MPVGKITVGKIAVNEIHVGEKTGRLPDNETDQKSESNLLLIHYVANRIMGHGCIKIIPPIGASGKMTLWGSTFLKCSVIQSNTAKYVGLPVVCAVASFLDLENIEEKL
jgi:hypothetical protein